MVDRQGGAVVPTDTWGRLGHSELAMKGTQAIKEEDFRSLTGWYVCLPQSARGSNLWILNEHVIWDS